MTNKVDTKVRKKLKTPYVYFSNSIKLQDEIFGVYNVFCRNSAQELSKTDAWKEYCSYDSDLKMGRSKFFEIIDKLERENIIKRNKYNRLFPANPPRLMDKNLPGHIINNNKYFDDICMIPIDSNRVIHIYPIYEDKLKKQGFTIDNFQEFKKLSISIQESVEKFQKSTGIKIRLAALTDIGEERNDIVSIIHNIYQDLFNMIILEEEYICFKEKPELQDQLSVFLNNNIDELFIFLLTQRQKEFQKKLQILIEHPEMIEKNKEYLLSIPVINKILSRNNLLNRFDETESVISAFKDSVKEINGEIRYFEKRHPWNLFRIAKLLPLDDYLFYQIYTFIKNKADEIKKEYLKKNS